MLKTFLVPLDGSALADRALPFATTLARADGGKLVLLRVVQAHTFPDVEPNPEHVAAIRDAELELAAMADRVRAEGVDVETRLVRMNYAEAATAILDAAQREQADLIVMSTHGRGGLRRWIYGSVADEVLRGSEVPVLLVPSICERGWTPGRALRILVPLDGSDFAEEALVPASLLAKLLGAELHMLRVAEPPPYPLYGEGYAYIPFDEHAARAEAQSYLKQVANLFRPTKRMVKVRAEVGPAALEISRVAREEEIDLIAMATHGHGGVARLVLGSVATSVLQRASVPVFLIRPAAVRRQAPAPFAPGSERASELRPAGPLITLAFSLDDLDLLERGLGELLYEPGRDGAEAQAIRELLDRLRHAESIERSSTREAIAIG